MTTTTTPDPGRNANTNTNGEGDGGPSPAGGRGAGRAKVVVVLVAVPFALALALWAFAWPAARTAPHHLPVAVASTTGDPAAAAPVTAALDDAGDAFDTRAYPSGDDARTAVEQRDVYAAFLVSADGDVELLTASAAAPAVAQFLTESAPEHVPAGTELTVTDLVPSPSTDPRGSALAASVLPLSVAGVVTGGIVTALRLRGPRALATVTAAAALSGLAATTLTHTWLGILTGNWWAEAGVITLTVWATASVITGLAAHLGSVGLSLGSLTVVLLGNAWAAVNTSPYLQPPPLGLLGQWLPPGAGANFLRSTAYFDGNTPGTPVLTLTLWTLTGTTLILLAGRRERGART
ncbi:ABC transporter permease [Streptomyces sp. NPDC091281]|uniref:ABC transporter permease n=1 Tax=Streptomyces sp. NPDC091281 TaxID=3365985 RepID=UPI003815EF2C